MAFPAPQSPRHEVQMQIVPFDPWDVDPGIVSVLGESSGGTACWPDNSDLIQHRGSCQCFYCLEEAYSWLEAAAHMNPVRPLPIIVQSAPPDRPPTPLCFSSLLLSPAPRLLPCPGLPPGVSLVGIRPRSRTCTYLSCTCTSVARLLAFPECDSARLVAVAPGIGSRLAEELEHMLPECEHLKCFGT